MLLERVGIAEVVNRKGGGFSKRMKQRLVLEMALVGDPSVLIPDEPRTGPAGATHNDNLSVEDALTSRWHPKTVALARLIPFDHSLRLELCIERFADRYDAFPRSRSTINRRVQAAAEAANLWGHVYLDCLRATAVQLSRPQGCLAGAAASTGGVEQSGGRTEVHPYLGDSDR